MIDDDRNLELLSFNTFHRRSSLEADTDFSFQQKCAAQKDFATIDFLLDAHRLRSSQKQFHLQNTLLGVAGRLFDLFSKSQGWTVVLLVGIATAISSAFIHDLIDFLSGFRDGVCSDGLLVSRQQCCLAEDPCNSWYSWSELIFGGKNRVVDFFVFFAMALGFASTAAYLVANFSPKSSGSGISEVQTILGGVIMKQVLGAWVLTIKSLAIILAQASGLALGSRGPLVHIACCWGNILSRTFDKYQNEGKKRELLSAAASAGVAVAFGAPLGGVLFTLEALSSYFPQKTLWRSFFCAFVSVLTLKAVYAFPSGKIVPFQISYEHDSYLFELPVFALLGVVGGLLGPLFIWLNMKIQNFRRSHWITSPLTEIALLSSITSAVSYSSVFLKAPAPQLLKALFELCENLDPTDDFYHHLCSRSSALLTGGFLLIVAFIKFTLLVFTFGTPVPTGIFMPSIVIGACIGRSFGLFLRHIQENSSHWIFSNCDSASQCIYPGIYAIVGASAMLSGISRMTVSLAVTMFEITNSLFYIVPIVLAIMVSKLVGDFVGSPYGIFSVYTVWKGYPFIPQNAGTDLSLKARHVMSENVICIQVEDETIESLQDILERHAFSGFPVLSSLNMGYTEVLGYVIRAELFKMLYLAIEEGYPLNSRCVFLQNYSISPLRRPVLDFSTCLNTNPVIVEPEMPLDILLDMFKGLGLRQVMVGRKGKLLGIVKKKDLLGSVDEIRNIQGILG